jgi:ketosteroid isomerase-like protein
MTTQEIADQLVALCKQGKNLDAIETLYSQDIVSVEAMAMPGGSRESTGLQAIIGKNKWWLSAHEVHSALAEGPLVALSHFCVHFQYDVTHKESGRRMVMDELAVYQVKDGKIVREEFFYAM